MSFRVLSGRAEAEEFDPYAFMHDIADPKETQEGVYAERDGELFYFPGGHASFSQPYFVWYGAKNERYWGVSGVSQ